MGGVPPTGPVGDHTASASVSSTPGAGSTPLDLRPANPTRAHHLTRIGVPAAAAAAAAGGPIDPALVGVGWDLEGTGCLILLSEEEDMDLASVNEELAEIDGQIGDILRALQNGFQKLDKIKDANRRSRQLEELTDKMRDCKRLIKDFERVSKDEAGRTDPETAKMLHDRKQSMIKELNSYVALKKQYASENKRIDLFDGPSVEDGYGEENVLLASNMTNQQLMDQGNQLMDETDQAIARSNQTVQETINVGTETTAALKAQASRFSYVLKAANWTEQMSRVVNELDSIHFSIKKASQLVKEIGRQVATDRCIMAMLFLIVAGVIAVIVVKIVNPHNKDIPNIPGLAPPVDSPTTIICTVYPEREERNKAKDVKPPPHHQVIGCMDRTGLNRFPSKSNRLIRRRGPWAPPAWIFARGYVPGLSNARAWKFRGTTTLEDHGISIGLVLCAV
ncbi:putative plant SNARE 11 isoform X1 [Panicum miliaceum]|uniref:Plant SNARE 11 isoform X1 n=1 Tax=Panicum miliaceum TaxID=4540 RepID=A0A3L6S3L7_PANMI|nr:putative plant SNARE 11 isoform X1 [Panicum miliaceum]